MPNLRNIILFSVTVVIANPLLAETVHLKNGEVLKGNVTHYYGGIMSLQLSDGSTRSVGQNDLLSVEFGAAPSSLPADTSEKSPPPPAALQEPSPTNFLALNKLSSPYASPVTTFDTWRKAAIGGDIDRMVDCYASFRKKEIRKQLKDLKKDAREKMREATARTDFVPAEPFYQGDRAFLQVKWTVGLDGDDQVLQFILEKSEWKLIQ